jgi:2-keto-4-pentenoate hydratase/2-oxohepta-3-ene-1,7-dioic acid hydratase in catechol pathway
MSMRLIRYRVDGEPVNGVVVDGTVHRLAGDLWDPPHPGAAVAPLEEVDLLAPCQPGKIVAVGLNYRAHAAEAGLDVPAEPVIFMKPRTAVIGPGAAIVLPLRLSERVDHEAELAVVIGRRARNVPREAAFDFVLGYTCGNDVTARDLQQRDGQWTRSKSFDTFCPLGPWIVPDLDVSNLAVRCRLNGELRQDGHTSDLLFSVDELIAFVSTVMTLEPGDVILTGTPAGVGPLHPGDRVEIEIEGIGSLVNKVMADG